MTDEVLNKANELAIKIKKLDDSIERVEYEIYLKKRFDEDIVKGRKPYFFEPYLKTFASVFLNKDEKPSIGSNIERHGPVEIELEDEEFFNILIEYMKQKRDKLREELDKL